jgi:hypothetical protein
MLFVSRLIKVVGQLSRRQNHTFLQHVDTTVEFNNRLLCAEDIIWLELNLTNSVGWHDDFVSEAQTGEQAGLSLLRTLFGVLASALLRSTLRKSFPLTFLYASMKASGNP